MKAKEIMAHSEVPGNSRKSKREQDEVTRLEKEIRELKALNRSLTKQLKKFAKGIYKQEALEALEKLEEVEQVKKEDPNRLPPCPSCGRNGLSETILAGRHFRNCSICDWKSGLIKK
jgi:septal ring factor EnvC (AmiA/AmiB activator)